MEVIWNFTFCYRFKHISRRSTKVLSCQKVVLLAVTNYHLATLIDILEKEIVWARTSFVLQLYINMYKFCDQTGR